MASRSQTLPDDENIRQQVDADGPGSVLDEDDDDGLSTEHSQIGEEGSRQTRGLDDLGDEEFEDDDDFDDDDDAADDEDEVSDLK